MKHKNNGFLATLVTENELPHGLFNPDGAVRVTQDEGLGSYAPNGSLRIGQEDNSSVYTSSGALNGYLDGDTLIIGQASINPLIPDTLSLLSRMTVEPTSDRKTLINDLIVAGKAKSFWSKLDALWVHAAHDAQAARLNWINSDYNCIPVSSPSFTIDRGYMGDGSTSYLDTQFNPTTAASPKYTQNSGSIGIRSNTDNIGTGSLAGYYDSAASRGTTINPRVDSGNNYAFYRVNQGVTVTQSPSLSSPSAIGMFVSNRVASTDIRGFRNGTKLVTGNTVSVAPVNASIRLGSINSTSFRACQFSMGFIGGGLTDQEVTDIYNWFETYRTALGIT